MHAAPKDKTTANTGQEQQNRYKALQDNGEEGTLKEEKKIDNRLINLYKGKETKRICVM